jgi:hypothetical protein
MMKNTLIFAALLIPFCAMAQQAPYTPQQKDHCMKLGMAYQQVAGMRDANAPATSALHTITASAGWQISVEQGKQIVNLVYSDPGFVGAGGPALANQVYQACLYPRGKPKPFQ